MKKTITGYIKCPFCDANVKGIGEHIQKSHAKELLNWINDEENKKLQNKMQQMQRMVHSNNAQ
jgi:hypothetical protein